MHRFESVECIVFDITLRHNSNTDCNPIITVKQNIMKSKTTATLLAFFLGGFGVHKFYLGQTGQGVLFLLTGGLLGIGALVNFIQLLVKSQEEFDARYNAPQA